MKTYFRDCREMLNEALSCNEHLSSKTGTRLDMSNSPILNMAINLNVDCHLFFLNKGFQIELVAPGLSEMPHYCMQMYNIY